MSIISAIFAGLSIYHSACKNSRIAGRNFTGFDIAEFSLNVSFVKTAQNWKLNTYRYSFMSLPLALFDICVSKREIIRKNVAVSVNTYIYVQ
jgi:hypothetical protein